MIQLCLAMLKYRFFTSMNIIQDILYNYDADVVLVLNNSNMVTQVCNFIRRMLRAAISKKFHLRDHFLWPNTLYVFCTITKT